MSLLSGDIVVAEDWDVEEWHLSEAHPDRETSAKAARQEKINVEGRMEVLVIVINVRLRRDRNHANGVNTPCLSADCRCKHQVVKTDSKKRSLRLGKFIASVYDVYFPRDHGHYGTDADHVPVIPGNAFAPEVTSAEGYQLQDSASDNMDMCQTQIGE